MTMRNRLGVLEETMREEWENIRRPSLLHKVLIYTT